MVNTKLAESGIDLWSESSLLDPFDNYRVLRDLAPVVALKQYGVLALPRFDDVRSALRNWRVFSSAHGVGMNERSNELNRGSLLTSDGPEHVALRKIIGRPLGTQAMSQLRDTITVEAEAVASRVAALGQFDGVRDLAWHLPLAVVRTLVGLPEQSRERMLEWGALRMEMMEYMRTTAVPGKLAPGSWGAQLYEAGERGEIPLERCAREMSNYVGPSLDTTINATTSALWLFAKHPDQWDAIRDDPALIPNAVQEVLRIEAPVQFFTRYVTEDVMVGDTVVPADSRVLIMYGSANRDERHWDAPERFDIKRDASDQLAFGHGAHVCLRGESSVFPLPHLSAPSTTPCEGSPASRLPWK